MPQTDIPRCTGCGREVTLVDRVGTEHFILDDDRYRECNVTEGLASELQFHCGHCGIPLGAEAKKYFYQRWGPLLRLMEQGGMREDGSP